MMDLDKYLFQSFNKVKINSKEIIEGDVFLALSGEKNHGNEFILDAIKNGAKYAITEKFHEDFEFNENIIVVEYIFDFLLKIAKKKRNLYNGKIIGITGSIGKTSVKENLNFFLSSSYLISTSIKSYNNYLGVIVSMLNLNLNSKYAIFELGTNNFLEIQNLTSLILPSQAIITNIFPTHLEKLINTRNIANEKSDIFNFKYNPKVELVILSNSNFEEKFIIQKAKKNNLLKVMTFGKDLDSDLRIKNIQNVNENYSKIFLVYKNEPMNLILEKNQVHRVNNILICLLFFIYNNIELDSFFSLTKYVPLIKGRGLKKKIIINKNKVNFIDESYNASPQSMKACIDYFSNLKINQNQKKLLILGDMKELGTNDIKYHTELLNYVSKKNLENVIICGELMKMALKKINNKNILCMLNTQLILQHINNLINDNDTILIKGSNSSLTSNLVKELLKERI